MDSEKNDTYTVSNCPSWVPVFIRDLLLGNELTLSNTRSRRTRKRSFRVLTSETVLRCRRPDLYFDMLFFFHCFLLQTVSAFSRLKEVGRSPFSRTFLFCCRGSIEDLVRIRNNNPIPPDQITLLLCAAKL